MSSKYVLDGLRTPFSFDNILVKASPTDVMLKYLNVS